MRSFYVTWKDRALEFPRSLRGNLELTLPKDANIHAREYKLYLPSKELLKKKLIEWTLEPGTNPS